MTKVAVADRTRPFRFLAFVTYLPIPMIGIMVVFALLGKLMGVGWLESAPEVLMIPMLLAYYLSLIMGGVYGFLKHEETVYLMSFIALAIWLVGGLIGTYASMPRTIMIVINVILIGALLVLHILQYQATKKWEKRLSTKKVPK